MRRSLSRNRRIATVCASCAALAATSPVLLGLTSAHSGISDFARGTIFGFSLVTSSALLAASITFLKRDRNAGSGSSSII